MESVFTISRSTGDIEFTYKTLAIIKESLLEALKRQEPRDDYKHLVAEIEAGNAAPMILADQARVGRWKLVQRDDELALELQHIQANSSARVIYTAPLEWQNGHWEVMAVHIKIVRRR